MGPIANILIVLSQVIFLKKYQKFSAEYKLVKNIIFLQKMTCESTIKMLAMGPISFIVKYFFKKSVFQKIWPEMWPPRFQLISNFNITDKSGRPSNEKFSL